MGWCLHNAYCAGLCAEGVCTVPGAQCRGGLRTVCATGPQNRVHARLCVCVCVSHTRVFHHDF